ncbi:antiviral innate immune response receptor RIG-I-like isoform X2 [Mytilus californianus]|uniref:antiviral innate immune response receptor RIG-I-like isoform X2 n=1 Tax=Mytilus californianus TaxID=6549 RepID=UPI0022470B66|nr:antiviral innate immune response receptor RIG-I-like isoform X2 [Mytilus californianus]
MTSAGGSGLSTKTHYARLGHAAQNLIPRFLQEVLLYYEHPKNIDYSCNTNPHVTYRLKSADWTKINEAVNTGSYKNFDIPLIYTILRNIHSHTLAPTNGWAHQVDPQPHETNTGDDLERCRRRRNLIIHRGNTEVSDQELKEYFDEFKAIAGRLQLTFNKKNNEFVSEVEDLRTCCMDEDTERKYLEEIEEWRCRGLEYEDQISQLKEHLLAMGISEKQGNENAVFIKALKETTCFEGKTVILQCIVSGSKCIAEWLKNDEEILYDRKNRQECLSDIIDGIHVQVYKLLISESTEEDSGTYTLKLGNKTSSCVLSITERRPSLIKLRKYQEELAEIAVTGQNTIICVGTNAGKTYVAYHIIEDHLIKYPESKVVFINKTNVLLEQQYSRACKVFKDLNFQGKIYKWDASEEGECEPFPNIVQRVTLFFCTPKSLCNHLDEKSKNKISMDVFTLIVLDECHHVVRRNPFNEIMNYYRRHKFESESSMTPQVLGLTASPGTNKADDGFSAVQHLKCLMANMDVSKLSVVRKYEQELLNYSSTPTKVKIRSTERQHDPVEGILFKAIKNVESVFTNRKVTLFLMQDSFETKTLLSALESPPFDKRGTRYVQWISETKRKTESVMLKDADVPRLIHICLRHLELYVECLEMNSLLEIENVTELLTDAYGLFSYESQQASTIQEREIIEALKDVTTRLREIRHDVESNPDVNEIIKTLLQEYELLNEDSRFLVFVKTRASAKALAKRLPECLKATHLTGGTKSKDKAGLHIDEQLEVMGKFREGEHLCIVATSVACEGLDIPQCNLMIRYKFRVDEISSYQMRGRIRDKGGREVILASSEDFERETKNILRQYYMKNAIEQVIDLDLTAHIAIAERGIYASEVQGRLLQQRQADSKTTGAFTVNCKFCGKPVTDGQFIRHIKRKIFIVYDKTILTRIRREPLKKITKFDTIKKTERVFGNICGHSWGVILVYQQCDFLAISKDKVNFFDKYSKDLVKFKKWPEFPYRIDEVSDEEVQRYLSQ